MRGVVDQRLFALNSFLGDRRPFGVPLNLDSIRCVERFDATFQLERMTRCQAEWSHAGVEIRAFGGATAIRVAADFPQKNVVICFDGSCLSELPKIISFYREVNRGFVFTLPYGMLNDEIFDALTRVGMRCGESGHVLAIVPAMSEPSLVVRPSPSEEKGSYLDLYRRAFSTQRVVTEEQVSFQWLNDSLESAQRFICEVDGEPVGMASLNIREGGAYCSTAGVLPEFRGRGVHRALIAVRVNAAYEAGCEVAFGGGALFGMPMMNFARSGCTILPLGTTWWLPGGRA